jgi:hypothetical protein
VVRVSTETELTLADFEVGMKVATQPHTDQFMQGLRFGRIAAVGHTYLHVAFHNDTRKVRLLVPHMVRITAPAHCSVTKGDVRCSLGWDHPERCHFPHQHAYNDTIADWWCHTCETVTDYCTENSPR